MGMIRTCADRYVLAVALALCACGGEPGRASRGDQSGSEDGGVDAGQLQAIAVPESGAMYHGVFPAGPDPATDISLDALDAYQTTVGRKVAWVYFDDEWASSRAFPLDMASRSARAGPCRSSVS